MTRKIWFFLAVSAAIVFVAIVSTAYAEMSISSLPEGGSSITADSVLPLDKTLNGPTVRATIGQLLGIGASLYQPLGTYLTGLTVTEPIEKTGTTNPSITCRVATDSVSGCLSASDHTAYSALIAGGGGITAITVTAPLSRTTGSTPVISMTASSTGVDGYLTFADRATLMGKQNALGFTAENTANKGAAYGYAGLDSGAKVPYANLSGTPSITTTSPLTNTAFAISMPAATDSVPGHLTAVDHAKITNAVPNTVTVNGHALSGNVAVTAADIGLATIGGRLLKITYLNASGTFTTQSTTGTVLFKMIGGGGGAGGAKAGATFWKIGAGGDAGHYMEKLMAVSPSMGYLYTIGAGGTPGDSTGGDGGVGGTTSITIGETILSCTGGWYGYGDDDVAMAYRILKAQASEGSTCTGGEPDAFIIPGGLGGHSIRLNSSHGISGKGADSPFGPGPAGRSDAEGSGFGNGTGSPGTGGAGAGAIGGTGYQGGTGADGVIAAYEYSGT